MAGRFAGPLRELRAFPRQYWFLITGTFVYVAAAALAFPYEGIFLNHTLGMSMSWIGLLFGVVPLAVMPAQVWGGALTDRFGRRRMMIISAWMGVAWFVGFAFVRSTWQVALLVAAESAFGWPLFQTASGAMIADLLPSSQRPEAYSLYRAAMNLGVVIGPAVAGLALAGGISFRGLFLSAAAGCFGFTIMTILGVRETRPRAPSDAGQASAAGAAPGEGAPPAQRPSAEASPAQEAAALDPPASGAAPTTGYRAVLADRRFLLFSLVAVLPVFCFGTYGSIFSVYITGTLHVPFGTWGLLLALNALLVAALQYPLVRLLRRTDRLALLALASVLVGMGLGLSAFVSSVWPLIVLAVVLSFGEMLLSPFASAVVSDLAPEAVRGRYMGVWTVVWNGGASLGPAVAGVTMDAIGGRRTFMIILAVGMLGGVLFLALRRAVRRSGGSEAYRGGLPAR